MVIMDRLRDFRDDIVYCRYPALIRRYPEIREFAPLTFSAVFMVILVSMLGVSLLVGVSGAGPATELRTKIDDSTVGARLRLSRIADRAPRETAPSRLHESEADANDPNSPMLIDIDPESGAVHASAGTIEVHGTPINIGNWPLDY